MSSKKQRIARAWLAIVAVGLIAVLVFVQPRLALLLAFLVVTLWAFLNA